MTNDLTQYNYEIWLLEQWARWVRGHSFMLDTKNVFSQFYPRQGLPCSADDDAMLLVDRSIAVLPLSNKRIIKRVFLAKEEVDNAALVPAVRQFSGEFGARAASELPGWHAA